MNLKNAAYRFLRTIDKVATGRGIYAASTCEFPRFSLDSGSSNGGTLKRQKCRAPSRFVRFVADRILRRAFLVAAAIAVFAQSLFAVTGSARKFSSPEDAVR